jgi:Tol biopolymer transport system component
MPVWSPDGARLYYRNGDDMMVVAVNSSHGFEAGTPERLFTGHYFQSVEDARDYDISPDGKYFLMIQIS